jgi:TolA-binding protein
MESPKAGLTKVGETIRSALESETESAEQIRMARRELLRHATFAKRRQGFSIGLAVVAHPFRVLGMASAALAAFGACFWLGRSSSPTAEALATRESVQALVPAVTPESRLAAPSAVLTAEPRVSAAVPVQRTPQRARSEPSAEPALSASANDASFHEALRAGRLAEALAAAESAGFEGSCERATGAELLALADAARLSGSTARATTALLSLRRRFPRSEEAATAAFALGRIAFDQRADYADAARWFQAYLEQLPNGPLMGDAAGRSMQARFRSGDRDAARAEAQRYLSRFPAGPYASQARRILSE